MANSYLDKNGLLYLWQKITGKFVAKETGKGLSTNDFTTELKNKLDGIAAGAQVNVKPDWNAVAGNAAEILNKPTIPSKTSDLQNDSGFITQEQVPEGSVASDTTPKMNGTAAVGTENAFARGDHVHPSDTTKADVNHNHDDVYLKLSGGQMTGPIQFSADQGQIAVDAETAAAKIEMDTTAAEIIFTDKTSSKTNRMTVSADGAEIVVGENGNDEDGKIKIFDSGIAHFYVGRQNVLELGPNGLNALDKNISHVATPVDNDHAANKSYVDSAVSGKANSTDVYLKTETLSKDEINSKLSAVYKPGGSVLFSELPEPSAETQGFVYNLKEAFVTDDRFLASTPVPYPIGTDVAVVVVPGDPITYKFDVMAGFVDLSAYMKKTDMVAITNEEIDEIAV